MKVKTCSTLYVEPFLSLISRSWVVNIIPVMGNAAELNKVLSLVFFNLPH